MKARKHKSGRSSGAQPPKTPAAPPKKLSSKKALSKADLRAIQGDLLIAQEQLRAQHEALVESHAALRLSHQKYADLFHFAPVGYVTLSHTGHVREINETAATMLGRPRATMKHTLFIVHIVRDDLRRFFEHLGRCRRGAGQVATELRLRRSDGTTFPAELFTAPPRDDALAGADLRTTIIDLTQLKRIEAELRAARDELEQRVNERTAELSKVNDALEAEIAQRSRLESELLEISERERRSFGQDLHDETCQSLAGLSLLAGVIARDLKSKDGPPEARENADQLSLQLNLLVEKTRQIARGLHPVALNGGLTPALEELAAHVSEKVTCRLDACDDVKLPDEAALALYRIAQEAAFNAVRHSQASAIHISLQRWRDEDGLTLAIQDNGIGIPKRPDTKRKGMGMDLMGYRAQTIGAKLIVERVSPQGTRVACFFNWAGARPEASKPERKRRGNTRTP